MENREAIEVLQRSVLTVCDYDLHEAVDTAISALEKQEQTNAQSVNSTHTKYPNALESLNILEQAKDDKGCVPMSLVRQAFRNVLEQDRWHSVAKEGNPKESGSYAVTTKMGNVVEDYYYASYDEWANFVVVAWQEKPEPYTEESNE